ncbi:hypothetical protein QCA50_019555 [Cerrena zonata]|uniref:Uncharacterized protein n=1 Tax=Cerrena zonata TaxID=2478898 RepID=A0AAW0FJQ2_9APHY
MGYTEEELARGNDDPDWKSAVDHPNPLTTKSWDKIKNRLISSIGREKVRRAQEAFDHRKAELHGQFWTPYVNHWKPQVVKDPTLLC